MVKVAVRLAVPPPPPVSGWWLPEGVSSAGCFGAYRGKGAASYAASKLNLNAPGTHDLYKGSTTDPTWNAGVGWSNCGPSTHLRMGGKCYPTHEWTYIIQVVNAGEYSQQFCGQSEDAPASLTSPLGCGLNNTSAFQVFNNFGYVNVGGIVTNGNIAIAGKRCFRYGSYVATCGAGTGTALWDFTWFSSNWAGTMHGGLYQTIFTAMAIYSVTLTDAQVLAVATEMAAF